MKDSNDQADDDEGLWKFGLYLIHIIPKSSRYIGREVGFWYSSNPDYSATKQALI